MQSLLRRLKGGTAAHAGSTSATSPSGPSLHLPLDGDEGSARALLALNPFTEAQVLAAHADAVRVLVAIDNTRLVSGGDDGNLHVWSIAQAHLMRTLTGHKSRVTCATPLRGGRLASAATDRTVRLWDPHLGECIMVLEQHRGTVNTIIELDSGLFCCGGANLAVYSSAGQMLGFHSRANKDSDLHALLAIKGERIVTASNSERVEVYSLGERDGGNGPLGAIVARGAMTSGSTRPVLDSSHLLSPSAAGSLPSAHLHVGSVPPLSSADAASTALRSGSGHHDVASGVGGMGETDDGGEPADSIPLFKVLEGHRDSVRCLAHASDGIFATASLDGIILLWSAFSVTKIKTLNYHAQYKTPDSHIYLCSVSSLVALDNYMIAAAIGHGFAVYNINTGQDVARVASAHEADIQHMLLLANGRLLLTAAADAHIRLWSLAHLFDDAADGGHVDPVAAARSVLATPFGAVFPAGAMGSVHTHPHSPARASPMHTPRRGTPGSAAAATDGSSLPATPSSANRSPKSSPNAHRRRTPSSAKRSGKQPGGVSGSVAQQLLPPCIGEMLAHGNSVNRLVACGAHAFASCGSDSLVVVWKNGAWQWRQRNLIATHMLQREAQADD